MFNPEVEAALAYGGEGYTPPRPVAQLAEDLETLPMFLTSPDDVVLVRKQPSISHLAHLKSLGFHLPEFVVTDPKAKRIEKNSPLMGRKLNMLRPWGWAPDVANFFTPLVSASRAHHIPLSDVVKRSASLHAKTWLTHRAKHSISTLKPEFLKHVIAQNLPVNAHHKNAVENTIRALGEQGFETIVVKAPLGSAGGAQIRIMNHEPSRSQWGWIERIIAKQGNVIIEPWYENQFDGSYLFKIGSEGRFTEIGLTHFFTDNQGRYRGTAIGPLSDTMRPDLKAFFFQAGGQSDWINQTLKHIARSLSADLYSEGLTGYAGIDFMIVKKATGDYQLRAPLELNPRPTMGHVAQAIARPFGTRVRGLWCLVTQQDLKQARQPNFKALLDAMNATIPSQSKGEPARLVRGVFSTTDTEAAQHVCSICIVDKNFSEVLKHAAKHLRNDLYTQLLHERHIQD